MRLERKILRVGGADRVKFLNDLITITVSENMPMCYGALLSPQGKILSDLFISSEGDTLLLDLPMSEYGGIKSKLGMYRLRADVRFEDDEREVFQGEGVGDPRGPVGARLYGIASDWPELDYRLARIRAIVPEFGVDFFANEAYPREWRFDEMHGVDYRKGCFVGQEIIARMRHKSDLLKSVVKVSAKGELRSGDEILSGEKPLGEIRSATGREALAFIRLKGNNLKDLSAGGLALTLD